MTQVLILKGWGYFLNMISFIQGSLKRAKIPSHLFLFNLLAEESLVISLSSFQAAPTVSFHKNSTLLM